MPEPAPAPLWQLDGIRVGGGDRPRLDIPALAIRAGITAVLGPSGSGKSTLLGLLVGAQRPDAGRVAAAPPPGGRLPVFWACAGDALWPGVSARRQLAMAAPPGFPGGDALLERFGLADLADRPPERLSSGERDRLDAARAVASDAATLVLDEPFARCGRDQAAALWTLVRANARERGQSLVVATHDPAVAGDADAVIELADGRIAARRGLALLAVAAALLIAGCGGPPELSFAERIQRNLPADGAMLPAPRGLCPLADGGMVVLDTAGRLLDCAPDGAVRRTWRMPEYADGRPEGACELPDGRIAVADTHYHRVVVFARDGCEVARWGGEGDAPGRFRWPVSICCDPRGRLWVGEYGGNDRVQRFDDAAGRNPLVVGGFGTGPGAFQRPQGLAWIDGSIYVSDALNRRISVWSEDGAHLRDVAVGACEMSYGMSAGPGVALTVADYGAQRMRRLGVDGAETGWWGSPGRGDGQLATPWAAAAARDGAVWIADTGNRRLWILRP